MSGANDFFDKWDAEGTSPRFRRVVYLSARRSYIPPLPPMEPDDRVDWIRYKFSLGAQSHHGRCH